MDLILWINNQGILWRPCWWPVPRKILTATLLTVNLKAVAAQMIRDSSFGLNSGPNS